MKYIFSIKNIDCANCAAKIERALQKEKLFEEVSLNFMLKKLEVATKAPEGKTVALVQEIAGKIESDVHIEKYHRDKHEHKEEACGCSGHGHEHKEEASGCSGHGHEHKEEACSCGGHEHTHSADRADKHRETHEEAHSHGSNRVLVLRLAISLVLLTLSKVMHIDALYIAAYLIAGYDVLWRAAKNIVKGRVFDENFLMSIATIAAFCIKEYPEAAAVMLFYQAGEYLQHRAVDYSRKAIVDLMDIKPEFARVLREKESVVLPWEVEPNEVIEVRPGEKIPLDGMVLKGNSYLDTSMLTGEAVPRYVAEGMEVLSGTINKESLLQIKVTTPYSHSTVARIIELIESAGSKKSKAENFITKFAAWYTPTVVILAAMIAIIPSVVTGNFSEWIYNSIIFLVISCPCALVVSIPLGFFGGIGAASKQGILIKGGNYLEKLNEIDTIVLDKTGTLTEGKFRVSQVLPANDHTVEDVIQYAAQIEAYSNHPIARSIMAYVGQHTKKEVTDYKEIPGFGLKGEIEGKILLAGTKQLMKENNIKIDEVDREGTQVYLAADKDYLGCIIVADKIKRDSKEAIKRMKIQGIKEVIMLTGDKKNVAERVAKEVGLDSFYAELLPEDKVAKVEELIQEGKKVAFIGDGINDAPVLARADVGIAMGNSGTDAAVEASDIVLMTDELSCVNKALNIAKVTRSIVTQNIVFALGIKLIVMILGVLSIANMWMAVFADVGVSLLAVLNAMRILLKARS